MELNQIQESPTQPATRTWAKTSTTQLKHTLAVEVLGSFGEVRLRVTGTSMLPSIWPGDILEVRRLAGEGISRGDLILFRREGGFTAHRVVQCGAGGPPVRFHHRDGPATVPAREARTLLVTRGDRLRQPDPPVSPEELLGRVTAIVRGNRRLDPRLTFGRRVVSSILSRSEFCTRVLLRLGSARPWR